MIEALEDFPKIKVETKMVPSNMNDMDGKKSHEDHVRNQTRFHYMYGNIRDQRRWDDGQDRE